MAGPCVEEGDCLNVWQRALSAHRAQGRSHQWKDWRHKESMEAVRVLEQERRPTGGKNGSIDFVH